MKALLLCGYRGRGDNGEVLGLACDANGKTLIDRRILELTALGLEPVCILSGDTADDVLRACPRIADVELVFDTNRATLASNLKAGLAATDGEGCYAIPVEVPTPDRQIWSFLREEWRRQGFHTEISVFHAAHGWHFPLLISRSGNSLIRNLHEFTTLNDTRLKYQDLVFSPLASA